MVPGFCFRIIWRWGVAGAMMEPDWPRVHRWIIIVETRWCLWGSCLLYYSLYLRMWLEFSIIKKQPYFLKGWLFSHLSTLCKYPFVSLGCDRFGTSLLINWPSSTPLRWRCPLSLVSSTWCLESVWAFSTICESLCFCHKNVHSLDNAFA